MLFFKKIWSFLISMKLMVILILAFATASAIGTFIENDHGINTSWALIYTARWFEAIQILLGISIVGNIFRYKMIQKKKIPVLIFHVGFLVVLIGSGITRYYGHEGVMHIREGSTVNNMLSSDAFLQIKATKDSKEFYAEDIIYISELGGREFDNSLDVDGKDVSVSYKGFIKEAVKNTVEDSNGVPIIEFIVYAPQGPEKHIIKSGESIDFGPLTINFDENPTVNKPALRLISNGNKDISFVSNVPVKYLKMSDRSEGLYEAGVEYKFDSKQMYTINNVQIVARKVFTKGSIELISEAEYQKSMNVNLKTQEETLSALIVDVEYNGEHREVALMGMGKRYKGYTENLTIDGVDISLEWGSKILELPFSLRLREFIMRKYPGSMSPSSYESDVTLIDKVNLVQEDHKIYMNHVLDYGGYLFFQSSYDRDEKGTILSVNHDPGKWPTYLGYALLVIGMFLNLFNPKSHFGKLSRIKYEYKAAFIATLMAFSTMFNTTSLSASDVNIENLKNISIEHANHYGTLLVQAQGRIKPLDTLTSEYLNKIAGTNTMFGLNHNQIILGMTFNSRAWQEVEMIKVFHPELKKLFGMKKSQKRFAYSKVFNARGEYILGQIAEESLRKRPAQRGTFDKEVIKVDERINVAYMVYSGRFMNVFPLKNDVENKWHYPEEALKQFPPKASQEVLTLLKANSNGIQKGVRSGDWSDANRAVDAIKEYQKKITPELMPNEMVVKAELMYNELKIFDRLYPIYLISGFILLILIFVRLAKPNLNLKTAVRVVLAILIIGFIAHTISLGMRWYISGHAPWSNGYEAMLYISWSIILSGILFAKSSELAVATTGMFAGITLFVAHLSWLDPQITTLAPVLKSYWLTIHVSIITASYGFLGLGALLGFVSLIFYIMLNNENKREQVSVNILESTRISEMSLIVGLSLLAIGNFVGGVWANESWGRYWGWDPKETWALITILVYVFVTHMRFVSALKSNFLYNAMSVVAYSSVIMTYFGVNYYLSGLHSYASGDPVPIPDWIYYVVGVIIILIFWASFNKDKLVKVKPVKQN
jgi:cytochrome c-type biogenesis protein CcsB